MHDIPDKLHEDIELCPRCGYSHLAILFRKFKRQSPGCFTHFGYCPTLREPILVRRVDKECYDGPIVYTKDDDE